MIRLFVISILVSARASVAASPVAPIGDPFAVAKGIGGKTIVHKFGKQFGIDTTEDPTDLWDCAQLHGVHIKPYLSDSTIYISSDDAVDTLMTVTVEGLDENGFEQSVDVALGAAAASSGTVFTQVGDANSWDRVYRAYQSSTDLTGNVYIHTDDTDTGNDGIPDAITTELVACLDPATGQTLMSQYTIPAGKAGYLYQWCLGVSPSQVAANELAEIRLLLRESGKTWRTVDDIRLNSTGSGNHVCNPYPVPLQIPALTDIRWWVYNVATNGTGVHVNYDIVIQGE